MKYNEIIIFWENGTGSIHNLSDDTYQFYKQNKKIIKENVKRMLSGNTITSDRSFGLFFERKSEKKYYFNILYRQNIYILINENKEVMFAAKLEKKKVNIINNEGETITGKALITVYYSNNMLEYFAKILPTKELYLKTVSMAKFYPVEAFAYSIEIFKHDEYFTDIKKETDNEQKEIDYILDKANVFKIIKGVNQNGQIF